MKRKVIFPRFLVALFIVIGILGCQKEADQDLNEPQIVNDEMRAEAEDFLPAIDWEDAEWSELSDGVFVTPEYYRSGLADKSGRFVGNCPTCTNSYCTTCANGWDCTDRDCGSSNQGGTTIQWYTGGTIVESRAPFVHQRYAECLIATGCLYDKDNRFYFNASSTMQANPGKLRLQYTGSKSWFCSAGPALNFLTTLYGYPYIRVATGQYCPTSGIRLVRIL